MADPKPPTKCPDPPPLPRNAPNDCPKPAEMENCPEPPPSNPDPDRCTTCPALPREDRYRLPGPQVEPEASFWQFTGDCCPRLCAITIEDLTVLTDDPASPNYFPPYPTDTDVLRDEIHELIELASLRDDPEAVASTSPCRERRDISPFLQYRPQPLGAVVNMERDPAFRVIARGRDAEPNLRAGLRGEEQDAAVPVVRTGRELARYFEAETPGLAHRHALNLLLRDADWSPPRQAWVWAALDVTIYSALAAAWYYKWLADHADSPSRKTHGRTGSTSYRPRPFEADSRVGVLYNREVSPLGDGDGRRRVGPVDPQPSPGTPRHPAYPSGHSTYSAAASELLSWFFPDYREEFNRLADNAGMARLWAGIHWRSDHVQGQRLGRTVACLVVRQLVGSYIPRTPDECEPPCPGSVIMPDPDVPPACRRPPEPDDVAAAAKARHECCEGRRGRGKGAAPAPGAPGGPEADRARGPQQGARGGALGGASAERSRGPQQGAR